MLTIQPSLSPQYSLVEVIQRFRAVSDEDKALLNEYFEVARFRAGSVLFPGDGVCKHLFFVCSGVIRILSITDKGNEYTHYFFKENQLCTILKSFDKGTITTAQIEASSDTVALKISRARLYELYSRLPYLKTIIDEIIQEILLEKIRVRNDYIQEEGENRYKLFLVQQPDIALRAPVKDIASFLGITRQSLSRIRKQIR